MEKLNNSKEVFGRNENTVTAMLYLAACGVNGIIPEKIRLQDVDMEWLYCFSCQHFMDALTGMMLQKAGIAIPKVWNEHVLKAVRKVLLFDAEREKLTAFLEARGIWYLPLKGILLKDNYPVIGMRQMSDNDILFDYRFCEEVQHYMESQGYEAVSVGKGNHDVYKKEPVYNFELHSALYGTAHPQGWDVYYQNVKERLLLTPGTSYGYHFTDEDFYVYITTHAYKHYEGSGTGLRTLLDFYVYLKAKPDLDFAFIEKECATLGIAEFEKKNRSLCQKVFDVESYTDAVTGTFAGMKVLKESLSEEEKEMLSYYVSSGVYGTVERSVENQRKQFQKKTGSKSKIRYVWSRLFPDKTLLGQNYPFIYQYKILLPLAYGLRMLQVLLDRERRDRMLQELRIVKKQG